MEKRQSDFKYRNWISVLVCHEFHEFTLIRSLCIIFNFTNFKVRHQIIDKALVKICEIRGEKT